MSAKPHPQERTVFPMESGHAPLREMKDHHMQGTHLCTRFSLLTSQKRQGAIHLPRPRLPQPCQGSGLESHPCTQG